MIGDPGQNLLVDVIEPAGYRTALAKPKERVVKCRVDEIDRLGRRLEPEPFSFPGVKWESVRVNRAVKRRRRRPRVSCDMAVCRDTGKRIGVAPLLGQARKNPPLNGRGAQPV